jgi:hypothetical protein
MRFIGIAIIACIVGFGVGLLIGRQFPAYRYQKYGETRYLLDSSNGKLCDPFKDPSDLANLMDSTGPKDANGFQITRPAYPPPCGK